MHEVEAAVAAAASIMKLMCGVGNNAAFYVISDANDQLQKHARYKGRVAALYKKVFKDWRMYESNLLYAVKDRFFHVADMPECVRSKYGDISDREYFEYWQGLGADMYVKTKPLVNSLTNKFRLSLQSHGVSQPDITAWALTGSACLQLACQMYDMALDSCRDVVGVPKDMLRKLFCKFQLDNITKAWNLASDELAPGARNYKLDDFDAGNIMLSYSQIAEMWTKPENVYDAASACITDFSEVFRNKKEFRIAIAEINGMREETIEERNRIKVEKLKKEAANG
jgi:hypothetical protein